VIGDGYPIHAPFAANFIKPQGFGVTFVAPQFLENPLGGPPGILGVNVEIDFHGLVL
jgi:hypothetical protein